MNKFVNKFFHNSSTFSAFIPREEITASGRHCRGIEYNQLYILHNYGLIANKYIHDNITMVHDLKKIKKIALCEFRNKCTSCLQSICLSIHILVVDCSFL